jgi:hypothetical protein
MTPPHIWESIIVHSAILFTPTGDKNAFTGRTGQTLEKYQRDLCDGFGRGRAVFGDRCRACHDGVIKSSKTHRPKPYGRV